MRMLLVAVVAACSGSPPPAEEIVPDAARTDARQPYHQTLPSGPCSVQGVTGTVPGVTLAIRSASCVYKVGDAATFTYEVTADAAVPALTVPDAQGCECNARSAELLSWTGWSIGGTSIGGERQQYCLCDVGCCPPRPGATIQPQIGTESDVIEWSGRTWGGPSDTGNPEGDFFEPGLYLVRVSFTGYEIGNVQAVLPIEVID